MRVPLKTLGLLAAAALTLAPAGCAQRGCTAARVVVVPAAVEVQAGTPVELRAYLHTDVYGGGIGYGAITAKRDEAFETATWKVSGPGKTRLTASGDRATFFTANPGTYALTARASGPSGAQGTATVFVLRPRPMRSSSSRRPDTVGVTPPVPAPDGVPVAVLDTFNGLGIRPGGTSPSFTLARPATVLTVQTYHYLGGGGPKPGTLALRGAGGTTFGPWRAFGLDGPGRTANALWNADPIVKLPAGTYSVIDSHPPTWSSNDTARGVGFTRVVVVYDR